MMSRSHWLVLFNVLLFLDNQLQAVHGQDLTVSIGPDLVTGMEEIVSGSDIQLFCTATSATGVAPDVSWVRNGATLDNNPPSVYFRTSSDGTTSTSSVLTIGDFQSADDGTYTCIGSIPGSGTTVSSGDAALTAVTFTDPNDANEIFLTRDPTSRETNFEVVATFEDDRVSVPLGTQFDSAGTAGPDQVMVAAATLGSVRFLETQSIVWVRDGVVIAENGVTPTDSRYTLVATATNVGGTDPGLWRTVLTINPFEASVAGVYQVIFTDNAVVSGAEVLTTTPIRLDTNEAASVTRVSPAIIDLVVGSEALLIEVSASGGYEEITWQRNGMALTGTFVSHDEVYYKATTDNNDRGEYTITAATGGVGPDVTVVVLPYTRPSTTIMGSAPITVVEGGSVDITCTSTGILTPTIEWELVGTDSLPFTPMDGTPVDPVITQVSPFAFNVGSLTSTLPITNAVFPDHEGTYRCTGTNTHNGIATDVDATVQVIVQVTPEVQVTVDRSRIQIGGMITLTCTVTRSNPSSSYTYTWTLLPSTNITGPTSSTESMNTLNVTPGTADDFGTYQCSVENGAGLTGMADITIEQGSPPVITPAGPTPISVLVGEILTLAVNITGFNLPLSAVTWSFGGITLMDGMDRTSITTPADLTTPPVMSTLVRMPIVSLDDEGDYNVIAINLAGIVPSRFPVTVNAPPAITFPTEATEVTVSGGDPATLTCSAFGAPAPEFEWFMGSSMTALVDSDLSGRVTISSMEMRSDFFYVNSTLTISSTEASDAATYTCRAINSIDSVGVEMYTLVMNALFQLRLLQTGDCATWVSDNPTEKSQDIRSAVADVVEMMCSCGFTAANIQDSEFSCRSIEDTVVFRAEIVYVGSFTADGLVEFISDWVQGGASIVTDGTRRAIDNSCPTQLDTFLSEDCVSTDQGETLSTGAIVGGIVGGVCVLLIITSTIIVVIVVRRRKQKSFSPTAEEIELSQGTVQVDVNPAYGSSIRKPALPLTSNPAYGDFSSLTENSASPYEMDPHPDENEGENEYDAIPYHLPSSTK